MYQTNIKGNYARFIQDQYYKQGFKLDQKTQLVIKTQLTEDLSLSATLDDTRPILPGREQNIDLELKSKNFGLKFGETNLTFKNTQFALLNKRLSGLSGYIAFGNNSRLTVDGSQKESKNQPSTNNQQPSTLLQFLFAKSKGIPYHDEFSSPLEVETTELTFNLSHRPVIVASERITIDGVEQVRNKDYIIDYIQGTITFRKFLSKGAKIYVDYEASPTPSATFERDLLGLRLESSLPSAIRHNTPLTIGLTYLQEEDKETQSQLMLGQGLAPVKHQVYGIDFAVNNSRFTANGELAQSIYNPNKENTLIIDDMEEEPTYMQIQDAEEINTWTINSPSDIDPYDSSCQLTVNSNQFIAGISSLSLTYNLKPSTIANPAFVYAWRPIYKDPLQHTDWTNRYKLLQLHIYGDNSGANLSIDLSQDKDNYYRYTTKLNFSSWRELSIKIPDDFKEYSSALDFDLSKIYQIRIYIDNANTNTEIKGTILIDSIKVLETQPLLDRWSSIETQNAECKLQSVKINDNQVLSINYEFTKTDDAYVEVKRIFTAPIDFLNYKKFSGYIYGDNSNVNLTIKLSNRSDNYFYWTKQINFSGWQEINLSLPNNLQTHGLPQLSSITQLQFRITPSAISNFSSAIYIDNIILSDTSLIKGEAKRINFNTSLGNLNFGFNYINRNNQFQSIGTSRFGFTRENIDTNISYKSKIFNITSSYNIQQDKKQTSTYKIVNTNNSLTINLSNLPQLTTSYSQRLETDYNIDKELNTISLSLSQKINQVNLSTNYTEQNFINNLNKSENTKNLGVGLKLSTSYKTLSFSSSYDTHTQKYEETNQTTSKTNTKSFNLSYTPSDKIKAQGNLSSKEVIPKFFIK